MLARILVLALGCSVCACAVEAGPPEGAREACMADFKKHCAGVMPGGGRVRKCLTDNLDKLAPECRAHVEAHAAAKPKN